MSSDKAAQPLQKLLDVMEQLRKPDGGCPWDLEQTYKSIIPYTIEEAYEVADAIENGTMDDVKNELGDLLLQVVFYAQMAKEDGHFTFDDVAQTVADKMIHRHPHVFGEQSADTSGDVIHLWEERKDLEKKTESASQVASILDDVPVTLPSIIRAQKLQKRAARVGFEWPEATQILDKLEEEIAEMREAIDSGQENKIIDELGDLLFTIINLGRKLNVNCEESIRSTNNKFYNRFSGIEKELKKQNKEFSNISLNEMEILWQKQK